MSNLIHINKNLSIPLSELEFRFSTSGGPGGQHANRSATRVTLLFDIQHSPSLDEITRQRLLHKLQHRLDKQGILQIQVQDSRSQRQNREIAITRFQQVITNALKRRKKRVPTKPSKAAKQRRLDSKKKRSQRKKERQHKWSYD